jgi:hypothetical protein
VKPPSEAEVSAAIRQVERLIEGMPVRDTVKANVADLAALLYLAETTRNHLKGNLSRRVLAIVETMMQRTPGGRP